MAAPAKKPAAKSAPASKGKVYHANGLYDTSGGTLKRVRVTCPKCGPSFYMAEHQNRKTCGKCGYTEFKK